PHPPTPAPHTLSLHDALPIFARSRAAVRPPAWRQWALAASVALAAFVALGVWLLPPSDTLAREVVAHVQSEPESWLATEHVTAADRKSTRLNSSHLVISYAVF